MKNQNKLKLSKPQKSIWFRLSQDEYNQLLKIAEFQKRSVPQQIALWVTEKLRIKSIE